MTTPTPIATFEDILQAMESDAGLRNVMRGYILDEEVRALPGIVAQLVDAMGELTNGVSKTNSLLETALQQIAKRLELLESPLLQIVQRLEQSEVILLRLTQRDEQLEAALLEFTHQVGRLMEIVTGHARQLVALESSLARFDRHHFRGRAAQQAVRIAYRQLQLRRPNLLYESDGKTDPQRLNDILYDAADADRITPDESDDISAAAFIIAEPESYATRSYVLGEVALTASADDISHAARRAQMLGQAVNAAVHPVVIGCQEPDADIKAQADQEGVRFFVILQDG